MKEKRPFTLIELLVVIAIIAILAGMLLPALGSVKKQGVQANCFSNMKQVGVALSLYKEDNGGWYPPTKDCVFSKTNEKCTSRFGYGWLDDGCCGIGGYLGKGMVIGILNTDASAHSKFSCRLVQLGNPKFRYTIGGNSFLRQFRYKEGMIKHPSRLIFAGETQNIEQNATANWSNDNDESKAPLRHDGAYVFFDSHTEIISRRTMLAGGSPYTAGTPNKYRWNSTQ